MRAGRLVARFASAIAIEPSRGAGQDRAAVFDVGDGLVIALADGAGGTGGGAEAAQAVIDAVARAPSSRADLLIEELDAALTRTGGQTTAIVLRVDDRGIAGAAVGDSGAWIVDGVRAIDLTGSQVRKPLVGAGAIVTLFRAGPLGTATLLVASDGLLRYAPRADIARIACGPALDHAARALIDRVRLANGELQDDVSIVLVRS